MNKGKGPSKSAPSPTKQSGHTAGSPAVSTAYAHNQNVANRAINKTLSARPNSSKRIS